MKDRPTLVALVGGSGSGKSWLSRRLQRSLGPVARRLSLDDFYRDQSHLSPSRRARVNFDHPRAIDWTLAETVLRNCRAGRSVQVPRYSFITHTRRPKSSVFTPGQIILVDGLWLLRRPSFRRLFDFGIFIDCPESLRLARRLSRDSSGRGRDQESVRRQFQKTVAPMHKKFVAPQAGWANVVLRQPLGPNQVSKLLATLKQALRAKDRNLLRIPCQPRGSSTD